MRCWRPETVRRHWIYFIKEKNIALIILDVMMPKINGWDVCREVRETSKVPIIMLTAKSDESDELTGFERVRCCR